MNAGLLFLMLAYVLSQFYRAFLAVMAPVLSAEIGMPPESLALASGLWFLGFACTQLPIGWSLDRHGPRLTAALLMAAGAAGGALVFATASAPAAIHLAMFMIGAGCGPVLMASYYIFARTYPPQVFATLAGALVGVGTIGNLASALPLAWAVEALGWRQTMLALAATTGIVAVAVGCLVSDPPGLAADAPRGSLREAASIRAVWPVLAILLVGYAPVGAVRGLWIGPFLKDVHDLDATGIGRITLLMSLGMVIGAFAFAPLDRWLGTRKWIVVAATLGTVLCLGALAAFGGRSLALDAGLVTALGFAGSTYAVQMAHGRAFFPPHLTGRGVTLLNLFSIGAVAPFQFFSGRVFVWARAGGPPDASPASAYAAIFAFFALTVLAGWAVYIFAQDRTD